MNERSQRVPTGRNVSRAIARSRSVRASVARRRKRLAAAAISLGTIVGLPVAWWMAEPARVVAATAVSEVQNLAELLGQRSPGTRTQDALTKHARAAAKIHARPRAATPVGQGGTPNAPSTADLVDLLQPTVTPVEIASGDLPLLAPPQTLGSIINSLPGGPAGPTTTPPDGGGPVRFPTSEPRENLPPTSAVPEPSAWALMLLGFGLIGWNTRRRRRDSGRKILTRA